MPALIVSRYISTYIHFKFPESDFKVSYFVYFDNNFKINNKYAIDNNFYFLQLQNI